MLWVGLLGICILVGIILVLMNQKRPAPTGSFVAVNGARVHYVQQGSGPDLVLLHGASGNLRDWTFGPMEALASSFRVTAFDRPGLGHSDTIANVTDIGAQARHLNKAARQIGLNKPIVLGHSYGGSIALSWALETPEEVPGLLLLSAPTQVWPGGLGWQYDVATTPVLGWIAAHVLPLMAGDRLTRRTLKVIFDPQPVSDGYYEHIQSKLALHPDVVLSNARQVAGLKEQLRRIIPGYSSLNIPVEILHGTADDIVPLKIHSEKLVTDLPNAVLTPLEGVGHMPQHTAWPEVEAALDRLRSRVQR